MINRGIQSVKFMRDNFKNFSIDYLRLRSCYILLSFGFELILKSRIVMISTTQDEIELNKELQNIGHNFEKISNTLGKNELKNIGITKIESKTGKCNILKNSNEKRKYFTIKTVDNKNIIIEDFTDVRYGCDRDEDYQKILEYISIILDISEKIKKANKS